MCSGSGAGGAMPPVLVAVRAMAGPAKGLPPALAGLRGLVAAAAMTLSASEAGLRSVQAVCARGRACLHVHTRKRRIRGAARGRSFNPPTHA